MGASLGAPAEELTGAVLGQRRILFLILGEPLAATHAVRGSGAYFVPRWNREQAEFRLFRDNIRKLIRALTEEGIVAHGLNHDLQIRRGPDLRRRYDRLVVSLSPGWNRMRDQLSMRCHA